MTAERSGVQPSPRVLLISTGGGVGGEESFTTLLGESLHLRGWDVRAVAKSPVHREELQRRGLRVEPLSIAGKTPWKVLQGCRVLGGYVRSEKVDVVHIQSAGPLAMCVLARRAGLLGRPRPVLLWQDHGIDHYRIVARLANHLDMTIAVADHERARLIAHGLRPERAARVHNGVDLHRFQLTPEDRTRCRRQVRHEFGLGEDAPVVGVVGRLSPEKAPDDFVRSFPHVRHQLPGVRYLIVGDGPMRPQLEDMIRDMKAEGQIVITGFRRDVQNVLCSMDVLAQVSHVDTFPLAPLEAMAMQVPCVVTAVGGNVEQVTDGVNGRIVPQRDPGALASALVDLLSDPAKRRKFGEAGHHLVHTYLNRDRMIAEIEAIYRSLLERRGQTAS